MPSILALTSATCDESVVTPVLAALEAAGCTLRAFDASRLGNDSGGAVEWVMRALTSEVAERKLEREVETLRPDAVLAFEVGACLVACELRKASARPFPVVAIVSELSPSAAWARCEADRFFAVDDEAAVALEDHGVPGDAIVCIGALGELRFAEAGAKRREALKDSFALSGKVALVEVAGLGHEAASQLALQLSLVKDDVTYLFDAGADTDAATAIRAQVPILGMRAKLFGLTDDAPLLWRCADVVIARPRVKAVHQVMAVGARMVCFQPKDGAESRVATAIEERGWGLTAANALMVGAAFERMLSSKGGDALAGLDGAAIVADAMWWVAKERDEVVAERLQEARHARQSDVEDASKYAEWAARSASPAGGLEDLGGASPAPQAPDVGKIARLKKEVQERKAQVSRTIADAQKQAASWESKRAQADKMGNTSLAKTAERNADLERARMHKALAEMAALQEEEKTLDAAHDAAATAPPPPKTSSGSGTSVYDEPAAERVRPSRSSSSIDEELERLRRQAGSAPPPKAKPQSSSKSSGRKAKSQPRSAVDDELAALKRKMAQKRKP